MATSEKFDKINDYTLRATLSLGRNDNWAHSITRLFNFRAAQVTTVYREWFSNSAGPAVTSQMHVQNFDDVQSQEEIGDMRQKLVELGGKPPALAPALAKPRALNMQGNG